MARRNCALAAMFGVALSAMIGDAVAANMATMAGPNPCADFESAVTEGLLDPFSDATLRDQRAKVLLDSAAQECAFAIRVAAGLSAQGDRHPARLLPQDLAAAEKGFLRVLEAGDLQMLSRLSYLASARGDWESAMGWAQLAGRVATMVQRRAGRKSEAEATRLLELFAERPDSGEVEAKAAVATLMEARGDSIRKGLAAYDERNRRPPDPAQDDMRPDRQNFGVMRHIPPGDYKFAEIVYVIGVDPKGRVARHWWFDAVPDARLDKWMGPIVARFRYTPGDDAGPIRWAMQPLLFVNGEFGLGAGGDQLVQRDAGQDAGPF